MFSQAAQVNVRVISALDNLPAYSILYNEVQLYRSNFGLNDSQTAVIDRRYSQLSLSINADAVLCGMSAEKPDALAAR